jgi:Carboxypeptidase regulatory-like domain
MHQLPVFACLLCTLTLVVPTTAVGQEITATITGIATDQSGAALPGVTVVAKHQQTNLTKETITASDGGYTLSYLPIGLYDVTFTLPGFKTFTAGSVELHVNDRVQVNASLDLGQVSEVVQVVGQTSTVQASSAVQTLMGSTQIEELPLNNRNFVQLATLVPGVNSSLPDEVGIGLASTVSLSMTGSRRNSINWLVDGASNVDTGSNITLLSTPTLESIQEFKIITSGYNAEWPRSGGGIVNIVTKSGTNEYRATGYEFFRDDALNTNSYFRKRSTTPKIRDNPAPLDYNNFGYTFAGPALRDKLFFFWSQEWRKIEKPSDASALVPNPAWLTNPADPNYVAPADRDPNAVRLLEAYPAPNPAPPASCMSCRINRTPARKSSGSIGRRTTATG